MSYFDVDRDGFLNYTEFLQMILPCDDLDLRAHAAQRSSSGNFDPSAHNKLPIHLERTLAEFLEREIMLHSKTDQIKLAISEARDWSPREAFEMLYRLSTDYPGYISHRNIQIFLRQYNFRGSDDDVIAIVRRLDSDADQKISY